VLRLTQCGGSKSLSRRVTPARTRWSGPAPN